MENYYCPICEKLVPEPKNNSSYRKFSYQCSRCGDFEITWEAIDLLQISYKNQKYIISSVLRDRKNSGANPFLITSENLNDLISSASIPASVIEKIDKVLIYIAQRCGLPGKSIRINSKSDYPIAYAENEREFNEYLDYLHSTKLAIVGIDQTVWITIDGWKKYEELKRNPSKTNQTFVAMWFGQPDQVEEMNKVYLDGIKRAVDAADTTPKYNPLKIDLVEHNDPIDQRILVEIRRSRFVVADLTGNRGGVYFEGGYALSLGIPVIWMCKRGTKVHFDIGQFSRIEWENENDLYEKLKRRIEGSIF